MTEHEPRIWFQAHRGGSREVPENTLAACRYAWSLGGIPEVDLRTTGDGEIICLHDETLARTTNAPDGLKDNPVSGLRFEEIREYDAGSWFDRRFAGERVPLLRNVFAEMEQDSKRNAYLDLKDVDHQLLADLIAEHRIASQLLVCSDSQNECKRFYAVSRQVRSMLWIGGTDEEIDTKFEKVVESGFVFLDQVQLHLRNANPGGPIEYAMDSDYLRYALDETSAQDVELQVFLFDFDRNSLRDLLNLGIVCFATDEPGRLVECLNASRGDAEA
jgi:glycerophosphoryl diester phosphodiesterase